ncbi:MAG: luciferase [Halolamina sp.]
MNTSESESDSTVQHATSAVRSPLPQAGIDAAALKPTECDLAGAADLPVSTLVVDYEGREALPDAETLRRLATTATVRVTTPVRATGFDPLDDDALDAALPAEVGRVLVAGHGAYLSETEAERAVAPRFGAAREHHPDAWVGTESVERIALATGGTQFELLSRSTARDVRALRAAGFEGQVACYAPTALTDDEDELLDALGEYVSRRGPVSRALPDGAETDSAATGRARDVLLAASRDFALVGGVPTVRERVESLHEAGVDTVVAYPARGLEAFLG